MRYQFLGYSENAKAYRFEDIETRRVMTIRDAWFIKDGFDPVTRSGTIAVKLKAGSMNLSSQH